MDNRRRNVTALGLLVIVASVLFFWGMYYMLGEPILQGGMDVALALDNGGGLKRGDRVHLDGVDIGAVRSIDLAAPGRVLIGMRLDDEVRLPADTRGKVQGDVFGAHTVQLVPGSALVGLEPGDTMGGLVGEALPDLVEGLGGRARSILASADALLSPQAVANLHSMTAVLPASAQELKAAFAELHAAARALRRSAEGLEGSDAGPALGLAVAQVDSSARAFTAAAIVMERSLGSLASVMAKVDDGRGTLGRLVNDTTLYLELNATLGQVRALATDMRERPTRYFTVKVF